jgi:hypothetical protein
MRLRTVWWQVRRVAWTVVLLWLAGSVLWWFTTDKVKFLIGLVLMGITIYVLIKAPPGHERPKADE